MYKERTCAAHVSYWLKVSQVSYQKHKNIIAVHAGFRAQRV